MHLRSNTWKLTGFIVIVLGVVLIIFSSIVILFGIPLGGVDRSFLFTLCIGAVTVGLALYAIGISREADKRYTEILTRIDKNVIQLLPEQDTIVPVIATKDVLAKVTVVAASAVPMRTGVGTGAVSRTRLSKADAQKRLDEDTKRVGYVRGEIYQLKDGSWGIHWGGKYPL